MKIFIASTTQSKFFYPNVTDLKKIVNYLVEYKNCVQVATAEAADWVLAFEDNTFVSLKHKKAKLRCAFIRRFIQKIFVVSWEENAAPQFKGLYTSLRNSREKAGLYYSIPYFAEPNPLIYTHNEINESPKYLAGFCGNLKSNPIRKVLLNKFQYDTQFNLQKNTSWFDHSEGEKLNYIKNILNSKFSLCPSGYSESSYRVQESMALGRCPVIVTDDFPMHTLGVCFRQHAIIVASKDLGDLKDVLKERESEWLQLGKEMKEVWLKYYSDENHLAKIVFVTMQRLLAESSIDVLTYLQSKEYGQANSYSFKSRLKSLF